ncbi:hypothetical protein JTE90_029545 [Oedothorax gibbosus]|uniref:Fucosyltransferase n=1 Tax=Oedothorax gibbosus TaxID=931172 RepID=A0AAV6VDS1_9ARAC|nr:hypothetical protein JTE90_029545 [Oedothorax gibbosus]
MPRKSRSIFKVLGLRRILALIGVTILTFIASHLWLLWLEMKTAKAQETTTMDPWIKKHWNHVKILTESVNLMQASKTILLWTKFFGVTNYVPEYTSLGCPVQKCFVTSNRDYLNKSDAVIFHLRDMNVDDMPPWRIQSQIWILLHHESPPHTPDILKNMGEMFNWTATYRYDSEIFLSPVVRKMDKEVSVAQHHNRYKKKMVAWLVSNCHTPSKREDFVEELQKHIPVDIYGTCGTMLCMPKMSDECYNRLSKTYRFYLSFENSICKDYVTEKFFNILGTNMVPVVMGGANYTVVAPPNSFIDALSFETPSDLARFLLQVAKDDKKYDSYFVWKKSYQLYSEHYVCDICKKLYEPKIKHSVYLNISNWWFQDANCRSWTPTHN